MVAKLNSVLEETTRKLEEAKGTIARGDRNGQAIMVFGSQELQVLQTSARCQWIALDE